MQADNFSPRLTVTETLRWMACLRIPVATRMERQAQVAGVLLQLRLGGCAGALVGTGVVVMGVSGQVRKRCVANELLTNLSTYVFLGGGQGGDVLSACRRGGDARGEGRRAGDGGGGGASRRPLAVV